MLILMSTAGPYPPSFPPNEPANPGDWLWSIVSNAWEWVGDQQAPVVALAAIATAVLAILALRSTAKDSRERSRPVVLAYFRKSPNNDSAFDLVVHNYGPSTAFEVDVKFDPPFTVEQRQNHIVDSLAQRYEKMIPLMPPGSEITNVWWALDFTAANHSGTNRYPIPDEAVMTITYKRNWIQRYKETVSLDTNWMKGDTSTVSSGSRPGLARQNTDALKKIAAELRLANGNLRDIAENTESHASSDGDKAEPATVSLLSLVEGAGGDMTRLAASLGVSEQKAFAIAALIESNPSTADIDVVSNGQIVPG
jgi:hypothetical protein